MENGIGERVKSLRTEQGMTLTELGDKANLSASYLSQIERDRITPSLSTLVNIARALNVEPRSLFNSGDDTIVVKRNGQEIRPEILNSAMVGYALSPNDASSTLQVSRVVIQPHSESQELETYSGEEMCFVLSGELTITAGDETYRMRAGDSIHYDALLFHSWSNPGDLPCVLIWSRARYGGGLREKAGD